MTPRASDRELKIAIASAVAKTLRVHTRRIEEIPEVLSVEIQKFGPLALRLRLRVRADHGPPRGQYYHYYVLTLSESFEGK